MSTPLPSPEALTSTALSRAGVSHGFFGRKGGVSQGLYASLNAGPGSGDDPAAVASNRNAIAHALGLTGRDALLSVHQVHGSDAVAVTGPWTGERPRADAMVSAIPGLGLCILTADCGPILMADPEARVIGAAHAGWRGAVAGIAEATIDAMEALGARRDRLIVALGPCIGPQSYEVGPDLREAVEAASDWAGSCFRPGPRGRDHFDLKAYIVQRLQRAGVRTPDVLPDDTYADRALWHSHRRNTHEGLPDYGRNASVIRL
jgi:YfiH family protein